jgi:hypothetical protein
MGGKVTGPTNRQTFHANPANIYLCLACNIARERFVIEMWPALSHRALMQSHELLREVFQKSSVKQVAADLGLSLSMLYKWAEPDEGDGSGTINPLDRIEGLIRSTDDRRLVQWICERAGGFFIRNPKHHQPHPDYLIPATNEIVQEFADLLAVIAGAAAN